MRSSLGWMLPAWLCVFASCDTDVGGGDEDERRAREAAITDLSAALCGQMDECECATSELAGGCLAFESDLWRARLNAGHDRVLTWDGDCVDAMAEAAAAAECNPAASGGPHPCRAYCAVFHGERELGESCKGFDALVSNCAQGLVCSDGHCVEPCAVLSGLQAGEPCSDAGSGHQLGACAPGLFCDRVTDRCAVAPAIGSSCAETSECGPDAFCDWESEVCRALPGLGASCWESPRCAQGLACQTSSTYDSATCVEPALADENCRERPCAEGLSCDFDDTCRPPADVGGRCERVGCLDDLLCEYAPETDSAFCREAPSVGATCFSGVCSSGAWCDFNDPVEPTCVAAAAIGEACTGHSRCTSGYCPAGWCEAAPDVGENCSELLLCAAGLFCDGSTCRASVDAAPAVCVYEGW